jgi:hypothetical protein
VRSVLKTTESSDARDTIEIFKLNAPPGPQSVVVNLCLCDEAATRLGLENFVCEVQLVLSSFAPLLQVRPLMITALDGPMTAGPVVQRQLFRYHDWGFFK